MRLQEVEVRPDREGHHGDEAKEEHDAGRAAPADAAGQHEVAPEQRRQGADHARCPGPRALAPKATSRPPVDAERRMGRRDDQPAGREMLAHHAAEHLPATPRRARSRARRAATAGAARPAGGPGRRGGAARPTDRRRADPPHGPGRSGPAPRPASRARPPAERSGRSARFSAAVRAGLSASAWPR